jgi:hypothetical protein
MDWKSGTRCSIDAEHGISRNEQDVTRCQYFRYYKIANYFISRFIKNKTKIGY